MSLEMPVQAMSHEHEPVREVHTFVVIDLDRTLLRSDELTRVLCQHIDASQDMAPEDGTAYEYIASQRGKSFNVLGYLAQRFGAMTCERAMIYVLAMAGSGMLQGILYPGCEALLDELDRQDIPYGILTYGDQENQKFKLDILHAIIEKPSGEVSAKVTDEKYKAQWIEAHWKGGRLRGDEEEWFNVHPDLSPNMTILAQNIVVVDDKAENTQAEDPRIVEFVVDNGQSDPQAQYQPLERLVRLLKEGSFRSWVDKKVQRKLGMSA